MRITRLLPALAVALLLFSPRNAGAQGGLPAAGAPPASVPVVEIRGVREATFDNWILADGVWRMKWPCLKVTLRTNENVKKDAGVGRAYFFDKDKKLVSELKNLPNAHHADGSYGLPPLLKARENIEAYVPIETVTKEAKWRVAVLVFGHRSKLTAEVYPRRDASGWKDYEFPEKEALLAQLKQEEEAKKNKTSLPPRPPPTGLPR